MQNKLTSTRRKRRHAMSLAEVMVVITVTSILLGVAISLLIELRDWDRNTRQQSMQSHHLMRLADTMRADIRQANEVSAPTNEVLLIVSPDEKRTQYQLTPEGCRRTVTMPTESKPLADLFAVGPAISWSLDRGALGVRQLFVVTLNRTGPDNEKRAFPLLVQAALGADLPTPAE